MENVSESYRIRLNYLKYKNNTRYVWISSEIFMFQIARTNDSCMEDSETNFTRTEIE